MGQSFLPMPPCGAWVFRWTFSLLLLLPTSNFLFLLGTENAVYVCVWGGALGCVCHLVFNIKISPSSRGVGIIDNNFISKQFTH